MWVCVSFAAAIVVVVVIVVVISVVLRTSSKRPGETKRHGKYDISPVPECK